MSAIGKRKAIGRGLAAARAIRSSVRHSQDCPCDACFETRQRKLHSKSRATERSYTR